MALYPALKLWARACTKDHWKSLATQHYLSLDILQALNTSKMVLRFTVPVFSFLSSLLPSGNSKQSPIAAALKETGEGISHEDVRNILFNSKRLTVWNNAIDTTDGIEASTRALLNEIFLQHGATIPKGTSLPQSNRDSVITIPSINTFESKLQPLFDKYENIHIENVEVIPFLTSIEGSKLMSNMRNILIENSTKIIGQPIATKYKLSNTALPEKIVDIFKKTLIPISDLKKVNISEEKVTTINNTENKSKNATDGTRKTKLEIAKILDQNSETNITEHLNSTITNSSNNINKDEKSLSDENFNNSSINVSEKKISSNILKSNEVLSNDKSTEVNSHMNGSDLDENNSNKLKSNKSEENLINETNTFDNQSDSKQTIKNDIDSEGKLIYKDKIIRESEETINLSSKNEQKRNSSDKQDDIWWDNEEILEKFYGESKLTSEVKPVKDFSTQALTKLCVGLYHDATEEQPLKFTINSFSEAVFHGKDSNGNKTQGTLYSYHKFLLTSGFSWHDGLTKHFQISDIIESGYALQSSK